MLKFLCESGRLKEGDWTLTVRNSGKSVEKLEKCGVYSIEKANEPVCLTPSLLTLVQKRYLLGNQIPYELPLQKLLEASTTDQTFVMFDTELQTTDPELKVIAQVKWTLVCALPSVSLQQNQPNALNFEPSLPAWNQEIGSPFAAFKKT